MFSSLLRIQRGCVQALDRFILNWKKAEESKNGYEGEVEEGGKTRLLRKRKKREPESSLVQTHVCIASSPANTLRQDYGLKVLWEPLEDLATIE